MMSRAWSTSDLSAGLMHALTDGRLELPDDQAQLKAALVLTPGFFQHIC